MLATDLRLALTLPWRIAVYTEHGATKIGLLRPRALLPLLSAADGLARVAAELEDRLVQIVDEAR